MAKAAERPSKTCGSARVFIGDAEPRIRSDSLRSPHIFALGVTITVQMRAAT